MKTRSFRLNKLVRDKIITSTQDAGGSVQAKRLTQSDFNSVLVEKLIEEAKELKNAEFSVEEIADIQEIIDQICKNLKISPEELIKAQKAKKEKNGGFENGDYIETVTLPADNKWAEYYASDPERFPEV